MLLYMSFSAAQVLLSVDIIIGILSNIIIFYLFISYITGVLISEPEYQSHFLTIIKHRFD